MRRVCLAFLAVLLLTTACSGERPTLDDSAAREVEPLDSGTPAPGSAAVAEAVTVRLAVPDGWSLDPADAGAASLTNRVVADLLYEGLTTTTDDGLPGPGLAERWFVSDDRLTWTFVLPASLTDGAGETITARHVKASLERVAARGPADQAATALTSISGWTDQMTGNAGGVAGIAAPDDLTVVIQLDAPYELLLDVLASPAFGITGPDDQGGLRTTGAFAGTDEPDVFVAVDPAATVNRLEFVHDGDSPAAAVAAGDADWAVLATGEDAEGLDADVIRHPLELDVAIVARSPIEAVRLGLLGSLDPLTLAGAVDGLTARTNANRPAFETAPEAALVDVPAGELQGLGEAVVDQLETAGITVLPIASTPEEFAARVAAGDALLFPIVVAGGTGPASAVLRFGVPGATDDMFGPQSSARAELAEAVVTELDVQQRALFIEALERTLVDEGLLLPVGQFEVRVALSHRLDGLRHRSDGTLDLSTVGIADQP
ncbi:MAG: ABC transporter substrate-binding protein [Acidimicrobiales bacterium]